MKSNLKMRFTIFNRQFMLLQSWKSDIYKGDRAERHCFFYHDYANSFSFSFPLSFSREEKREKERPKSWSKNNALLLDHKGGNRVHIAIAMSGKLDLPCPLISILLACTPFSSSCILSSNA